MALHGLSRARRLLQTLRPPATAETTGTTESGQHPRQEEEAGEETEKEEEEEEKEEEEKEPPVPGFAGSSRVRLCATYADQLQTALWRQRGFVSNELGQLHLGCATASMMSGAARPLPADGDGEVIGSALN
eukprot:COSAG01_NODE_199_length_22202_cov_23.993668_17_plen_131_part_00